MTRGVPYKQPNQSVPLQSVPANPMPRPPLSSPVPQARPTYNFRSPEEVFKVLGNQQQSDTPVGPYKQNAPQPTPYSRPITIKQKPTTAQRLGGGIRSVSDWAGRMGSATVSGFSKGVGDAADLARGIPRRVSDVNFIPNIERTQTGAKITKTPTPNWLNTAIGNYESAFDKILNQGIDSPDKRTGKLKLGESIAEGVGGAVGLVGRGAKYVAGEFEEQRDEFAPKYEKDERLMREYESSSVTDRVLKHPLITLDVLAEGAIPSGMQFLIGGAILRSAKLPQAMMGASITADIRDKAMAHGVEKRTAENLGLVVGIPSLILEGLGWGTIMGNGAFKNIMGKGVSKNMGKGVFKNIGRSFGGHVLKSAISEGVTEFSQESIAIAVETSFREVTGSEVRTRLGMSALGGVFGGSLFGASAASVNAIFGKKNSAKNIEVNKKVDEAIKSNTTTTGKELDFESESDQQQVMDAVLDVVLVDVAVNVEEEIKDIEKENPQPDQETTQALNDAKKFVQDLRNQAQEDVYTPDVKQEEKVVEADPLVEEARKFDNVDDFVEAQPIKESTLDSAMQHRPSFDDMPPASDLLQGDMLPRDVYESPDHSIANGAIKKGEKSARESWEVLQEIRNKPNAKVTIYRAAPKNELRNGDWVSLSKEYATLASQEEGVPVHSFEVKAKDVIFAGDDINEFGYWGHSTESKTQLEDIYKQAHSSTVATNSSTESTNSLNSGEVQTRTTSPKYKTVKQQLEEREIAKIEREIAREERATFEFPQPGLESQYQTFKKSFTPIKLRDASNVESLRKKSSINSRQFDNIFYSRESTADEVFDMFKDRRERELEPLPVIPKETRAMIVETVKSKMRTEEEIIAEFKSQMRTEEEIVAEVKSQIQTEKDIVEERRRRVKVMKARYNLSDADLKKVTKRDIRLMDQHEFKQFIDDAELRAVEIAKTRDLKNELVSLIRNKELRKVENYRRAKELPPISKMTNEQLQTYIKALERFEVGDVFLTQRTLEVVDRTALKGVRTERQAKKILAKEFEKRVGRKVTQEEMESVSIDGFDTLRYDTALAEKNPFYNFMVTRTHEHLIAGEANFLEVQATTERLAKRANKSRKRNVVQKIKHFLIPQHHEMIAYLEAEPSDKDALIKHLTDEEVDYVMYVEKYYDNVYNYLIASRELYGSRFNGTYFTHTRKGFLETAHDSGLTKAVKNIWQQNKDNELNTSIVDHDTGKILAKNKFFQNTIQRTGAIDPSHNLTQVFLQYAKTFERKKMLDSLVGEMSTYTQILTPKNLTKHGHEADQRLKTFVNKYLNNKKGIKEDFGQSFLAQNGRVDVMLRIGNAVVTWRDLAGNIASNIVAPLGEQIMAFQGLGVKNYTLAWKRRMWDTGAKNLLHKNATKILKQAEPFIGRNIWTELSEIDKGLEYKFAKGVFGIFHQGTVEANKIFLLGSISKEELNSGTLTNERMAELRLEAGRWRDMGRDVKSIIGSTSIGATHTKYKGWAIPSARTTISNLASIKKSLQEGDAKTALTKKEAKELYRAFTTSLVIFAITYYVVTEDDDDTFVGKLKARIAREALTFMGSIDPRIFVSIPRLVTFIGDLTNNLFLVATMAEYQSDTKWGKEGENMGIAALKRQFSFVAYTQFNPPETTQKEIWNQLKRADTKEDKAAIIQEYKDEGVFDEDMADEVLKLKNEDIAKELWSELKKADTKEEKSAIINTWKEKPSGVDSEVFDIALRLKAEDSMTYKEKRLMNKADETKAKYVAKELDKLETSEEKKALIEELKLKGLFNSNIAESAAELKGL